MTDDERRQLLLQIGERNLSILLHLIDKPVHQGVEAAPSWCSCLKCRDMPTQAERICCKRPANKCQSQLPVSYYLFTVLTITVTFEKVNSVGRFIKII